MYREIAGTDEQVRAIPGVPDRRVRATKVRLYMHVTASLLTYHGNNFLVYSRGPGLPFKSKIYSS